MNDTEVGVACSGAKSAAQINELLAETIESKSGVPLTPERVREFTEVFQRLEAVFYGQLTVDRSSGDLSYECKFSCQECLGRVGLSAQPEVGVITMPGDCVNTQTVMVSYEEVLREL